MDYVVIPGALSGYDGCNTIRIMYMIHAGVQVYFISITNLLTKIVAHVGLHAIDSYFNINRIISAGYELSE